MKESPWEVWVYEPGVGAWCVAEHHEATEARDDACERNAAAAAAASLRWFTWRLHNEVDCDCDVPGGDVSRAVRRDWEAAHPDWRERIATAVKRAAGLAVVLLVVLLVGCAGGGVGERCDANADCDPGLVCAAAGVCTSPSTDASVDAGTDAEATSLSDADTGTDAVAVDGGEAGTDATPPGLCSYCAGVDGAGAVWCELTCTGAWPCCDDWCSPACMICEGGVC